MKNRNIESVIQDCLERINLKKPTREDLVIILAQMLIRSGYSIHWGLETPRIEGPKTISQEEVEELHMSSPSTGTTLMHVGFNLQEDLLLRKR